MKSKLYRGRRSVLFCFFFQLATALAASAEETNSALPRAADTNSAVLSVVDTNSALFSVGESNSPPPRETRSVSVADLQSFRVIWERNIFNPSRAPGSTRLAVTRDPGKPARIESFALVGTMSYEKGSFAFFESPSSQYQKVLETSGNIAGYKIVEITPTHVKLESTNGQPLELPVGMQMKKEEAGEWMLGGQAERSSAGGKTDAGADASEVLKRLLQKREQEGNTDPTNTLEAPLVSTEKAPAAAPEKAEKTEKPDPGSAGAADDILKKLLQKREQELNK